MNKFLSSILNTIRNKSQKGQGTCYQKITATSAAGRPITDSFACPYCASQNFVKRGFRQKKMEKVQLYLCMDCGKTFTPHITKGKHYPLPVMFDAISIYNLGYSLEETCRIVNKRQQKTTLTSGSLASTHTDVVVPDLSGNSILQKNYFVKSFKKGVDPRGVEPLLPDLTGQIPHRREPTPKQVYTMDLQPSTLSNWINETGELCRFERMREYAVKKYSPRDMVATATLAHRQLYRYRFHRAKCDLIIQDDFKHRRFGPLQEFLEMVPGECPHQYFNEGLRASETPLTFSKTQMIVRSKQNYATKLAEFVLQSVKDRKQRHDALQKFMLANDTVTVATEVPVYLTRDDLEHMQTQLGFEIYAKSLLRGGPKGLLGGGTKRNAGVNSSTSEESDVSLRSTLPPSEVSLGDLPKLITGHIDILQIRNGQAHILDYKPNAEKERPIEQLTLYAMALSRLTGLRLFEFKCAWFDENDYFEFYPLHVLHKPKKSRRYRKVYTMEGIYNVNKDEKKILNIKPISNY